MLGLVGRNVAIDDLDELDELDEMDSCPAPAGCCGGLDDQTEYHVQATIMTNTSVGTTGSRLRATYEFDVEVRL